MVAVEEGMFAIGSPIQTINGPVFHAANETSCSENNERYKIIDRGSIIELYLKRPILPRI